jgi:hypothetical protein
MGQVSLKELGASCLWSGLPFWGMFCAFQLDGCVKYWRGSYVRGSFMTPHHHLGTAGCRLSAVPATRDPFVPLHYFLRFLSYNEFKPESYQEEKTPEYKFFIYNHHYNTTNHHKIWYQITKKY